ncbi:MAG: KH domain-containing protein [Defluviitaleaceae bacterium]|nr:KH domain-containing protein [Defluviitaleaceae bacterium]
MDFIEMIKGFVTPLARNHAAVVVKEVESTEAGTLMFEILVAQDDLGRVIGREGRVANALRTITYAAAIKEGFKVKLTFAALPE